MCRQLSCLQRWLESAFYTYGNFLSRHPLPFIIIPLLVTCLSTIGLMNLQMNDDPEYLYTPTNGPAKKERTIFQQSFTENDTHLFMPTRKTGLDGFLNVIITRKDNRNIFTVPSLAQIIRLNHDLIQTDFHNEISYLDVCALWKGSCMENMLIQLLNGSSSTIEESPVFYPSHNGIYFLAGQLGGVSVNNQSHLTSAKAVYFSYFVRYATAVDKQISDKWLTEVKNYLLTFNDQDIMVNFQTSLSLNEELAKSLEGILPRFSLTYTILLTFCAFSCAMTDWVRTKVWVVMAGTLAAGMAVVTSLGLLCAIGVPFATTVASMPFLIIGIGIDDMFVILSSWRHTSYTLPVEERMGRTMKIAAISITVTSVTDALAFGIGAITVFRAVTLFCAYTGVAVIFSYIYAITFLAACFVISGRGEEKNQHEMTCKKILPFDKAGHKSKLYQVFCTGGYIEETEVEREKNERYLYPLATELIKNHFAPFLMKIPVKIFVILIYCIYIAFAIWGCLNLKEGLKIENLSTTSSYLRPYFKLEEQYFRSEFGARIMIGFTETLDYSSELVRYDIDSEISKFRNSRYYFSNEEYVESWLSTYMGYLELTNQNPTDMVSFIHILRTEFLTLPPYSMFQLDVTYNSNHTTITASRFLLQSKGDQDAMHGEKLMTTSRDIARQSKFNITVYHPMFIFLDQFTVIFTNTMQNLGIAVGSMLIVSLLLLPSFISAFCVTASVISICTGVIGYMAFWDVSLDSVSMINLIMCIGFSVDFSAHISYHFSISKQVTGDERAKEALGHIGMPILQGALSTILGVAVLSTSESYIFMTFFKIMFLVMFFGFLHAMILLPVVLSCLPSSECCVSTTERELRDLELQNRLAFSEREFQEVIN